MKWLITGGAGFIGSNFIYYMQKEHPAYDLTCVDLLTYAGNIDTLKAAQQKDNFHFVKADISDKDTIYSLFKKEKFDVVVNFAAESHVDRSISNPEIFIKTNIMGTQILLDACKEFGVSRFHQVSTDEVYGDLPIDRPDLLFTERTPLNPSSPYSASKAGADLLVQSYFRTFSLPVTISRCSNNYGRYQFVEKLIPLMILKARKNERLPVYGEGLNVRDWLWVDDHCQAIDLIIHNGKAGEIYNIGGHNEKTNIEVVKLILKEAGKPEDLILFVKDRLGHDLRYAIDPTKIFTELGWRPKTSFDEGIKQTIKWYNENADWWQPLMNRV